MVAQFFAKPSNQQATDASAGHTTNVADAAPGAPLTPTDHRQAFKQEDARIKGSAIGQLAALQLDDKTTIAGAKPGAIAQSDAAVKSDAGVVKQVSSGSASQLINMDQMKADAAAIFKAADADYRLFRWSDKDAINKILEGKSDAERQAIGDIYKTAHGVSLDDEVKKFESGSDLVKFQNVFHRQDNDLASQNANRLREDMVELHEWGGRSGSEIEKDIRDTLAIATPAQFATIDADYHKQYGSSLYSSFMVDHKLSQATRDSISVYTSGIRDDQSTSKLIDIALKAKNLNMFEETMRDASSTARKSFLDNGGENRIQSTFGQSTFSKVLGAVIPGMELFSQSAAARNVRHAEDYANSGQLSTLTQVADNTGYVFNNPEGYKLAIQRMSDDERKEYFLGKQVSIACVAGVPQAEQDRALQYYNKLHNALSKVSNTTTMVAMEDLIANGGKPTWVGTLARHRGLLWNDSGDSISKDINGMTKEQWTDCKTNPEHRDEFIAMLSSLFKGPDEVTKLLNQYDQKLSAATFEQSQPPQDLVSLLNAMPRKWNGVEIAADTGDAVRLVEKTFAKDSQLQERVLHPQTADDKKYSDAFKDALKSAIGGDFDIFGQPLTEAGRLPLDLQEHLNIGIFGNDVDKTFKDVADATPAERARLKTDSDYRASVLSGISSANQRVALQVAEQGKIAPEDKLRSLLSGWGGSSSVVDLLGGVSADKLAQVEQDYTRKYGGSLEGDVLAKLTGQDRIDAQRTFTEALNINERADIARTETELTRSGFGAWASDNLFRSGTGPQADDTMNQTTRVLGEENQLAQDVAAGSNDIKKITPEQLSGIKQHLDEQSNEALDVQDRARKLQVASKAAAADYASDALITAGTVVAMMTTAGTAAVPLALIGATLKVGTDKLMEGNDYDESVMNVTKDAVVGGASAAATLIGSGQLANLLGVGESAAAEGTALTMTAVQDAGMEGAIKEGGNEILENGAKSIMRDAFAEGAKKVDQAAFTELAEQVVSPGLEAEARDKAVTLIAGQLQKNLTDRMATGVAGWLTAHALYSGSAALGGAVGGFTEGSMDWDDSKTVNENLERVAGSTAEGAVTGALAGSATHIVFNGTKGVVQTIVDATHGKSGVKFIGVDDSSL